MKTIPYTYHVYCRPVNKHYYGVRYADGCCPDDLFKLYFTSSKIVHSLIEAYGKKSFDIEIRRTFKTPAAAFKWEQTVLRRMDLCHKENWLNRALSGIEPLVFMKGQEAWNKGISNKKAKGTVFYNNGEIQRMYKEGRQPKGWKKGRLGKPWNAGKHTGQIVWNKDKKGLQRAWNKGLTKENNSSLKILSEIILHKIENGEIIPHSLGGNPKGIVIAKDLDGNLVKVSVEEFRTREDLKGVNFGIHPKYTTVICPHCNKQGGTNCMKRWHFNNCRLLKDKK